MTEDAEHVPEVEVRPPWAPAHVDMSIPSVARIYDRMLGGGHNFNVDREMAAELERAMPGFPRDCRSSRAFLSRAARFCTRTGIDQFLDIGSGIPTVGNVHEIVQEVNPDARTVYVDMESVAVAMGRKIVAGDPNTAMVQGDLRRPQEILDHPDTRALIDFTRPVAVIMVAVLHVIPDADDPAQLVTRLTADLVPGSMLVASHKGLGTRPIEQTTAVERILSTANTPLFFRSAEQLRAMMGRFTPLEPGVVPVNRWRPAPDITHDPRDTSSYGGVGRFEGA